MHENAWREDEGSSYDERNEGRLVGEARSSLRISRTREERQLKHNARDILKELLPSGKCYAESDGFRLIEAFPNSPTPLDVEELDVNVIIAIGQRIPLKVYLRDPHGHLGQVIWVDQEWVSLQYDGPNGGYNVWKRAELGLVREPSEDNHG